MSRSHALYSLLIVCVILSGCGNSPTVAEQQNAAELAVHKWVDLDDCAMMSDRYAAEGEPSAEQGKKDCAADTSKGLRAGEYKVAKTQITGNTATVTLDLEGEGTRTYKLVNQDGAWKIDGSSDAANGVIGDTFLRLDSFEQDGRPVEPDLLVRAVSIDDPARPPRYLPPRSGRRYVRAKFAIKSRGPETFSQSTDDFYLVDGNDRRYPSNGGTFEPSLGYGAVDLSKGDRVVGYLSFEVPKDAKVASIRMKSPLSSGPTITWAVRSKS